MILASADIFSKAILGLKQNLSEDSGLDIADVIKTSDLIIFALSGFKTFDALPASNAQEESPQTQQPLCNTLTANQKRLLTSVSPP